MKACSSNRRKSSSPSISNSNGTKGGFTSTVGWLLERVLQNVGKGTSKGEG